MTNNTKQGLIVSIGFLAILFVIGLIEVLRFTHNQVLSFRSELKYSLEQPWKKLLADKSNAVNQGVVIVTSEDLCAVYCGTNKWSHGPFLRNLWFSKEPVKSMSTNVVCAWSDSDNGGYAIDANGEFRELTKEEFAGWPHISAQEAQATNDARH